MADTVREIEVFVSSPGDARFERSRVERVAERLNGEFQGVARLIVIRWETEFYKAHETFQAQIKEAGQCDIVVAVFRGRLGTALPTNFPPMPDGKPYPSGTAYEVLSAIEAHKGRGLPDVYVFRYPQPPSVQLDDPQRAEIESQWAHLKSFFESWFQSAEGQFKAAFQTFGSTDDFETQVEQLLRRWLEEHVLHGRSVAWPVETKGSPFRGLASFGAKHAPVFFGRSRDLPRAVDRLKDAADKGCPFLLVVGGSGSGKSSLVRAGLVPRLTASGVVPSVDIWRIAEMRPGERTGDPFAALADSFFVRAQDLPEAEQGRLPALPELAAGDFKRPDELGTLLGHADETALKPVVGTLTALEQSVRGKDSYDRPVRATLLLVVDQLDELFDAQVSEDVRARFAKLLGLLARSGRVWLIATLRADLFDRFLAQPDLKKLKEDGASYDLAPPDAAELAEIVRGPAAAADLVFETDRTTGERLDERLLKDAERPDLLPLLQFTLNQLFAARQLVGRESRLTFAAYQALGGLEGAVDKEGEAALAAVSESERAQLPRLLRELAAPSQGEAGGSGRTGYDIRSVLFATAAHDAPSTKLVNALIDTRILLSSGDRGEATVRLAHSRVLDSWKRAKAIVAENADFFRIRAEVEAQRRRWEAHKPRDLLIGRGRPLAEAESIARRFPEELSDNARDFIKRSGRRARLSQTLTGVAAILFAAVAVAAFVEAKQADNQRQRAEQALTQVTEAANSLVFTLGQDPRMADLPPELLKQMLDQAIASYGQAIALNPKFADAFFGRGTAYEAEKIHDKAVADYDQAIALNAAADAGTFSLAGVSSDPRLANSYYGRGNAYNAAGDYDRAIEDYTEVVALNPNNFNAFYGRGNAYNSKGDYDDAIADYTQVTALDPKYSNAYYGRGNAYNSKGDYDHAIADYTQATALDPKYSNAYYGRGTAYNSKGDYDHAIADYTQVTALDPKYSNAYYGRGNAYNSKGDYDQAIADYTQVIALDPKYANAFYGRGTAYYSKGDYDSAIADYSQVIMLDAKYTNAYYGRGNAYSSKGVLADAIGDYSQVISLDPKNANAFYARGLVEDAEGSPSAAIADYTQVIALRPDYTAAYSNRCWDQVVIGQLQPALSDCGTALQAQPNSANTLANRGFAYFKLGRFANAITDFTAAITLSPKLARALYGRGLARQKSGDSAGGNADLAAARAITPNVAQGLAQVGIK